ncbi:complex I NDUFA9 subunit family protein [Burkholderiaceae bacterium FT117]|uniref:complex I NDUFA9 subunit family protein n=1 Tax=Zeimonas sediminis TaxID=2944268 RepID=UPI002342D2DE|nr:complex I NDUFA9 subunit family protein [Zeimonas sediminis]MCM5571643.1 complex I NDUFA9 subunit family protein [Zeimonas sediminis]
MRHSQVLVIGGSGFIGGHLVAELAARGKRVVVPTRNRMAARRLLSLPTVDVVEANVNRDDELASLVARADAVVNLVGLLHDRRGKPWGPGFEAAHVRLPARIAAACVAAGVHRLLHMSALGVVEGGEASAPSMYLRSKAAGERAVRESGVRDWTIFRPSVVFGPDDRFLNLFARLQKWLPFMALGRADAKFQPVYVGDVARAFANALDEPATFRHCYELAGPDVYTLRELVRFAGELAGARRPVIGLNEELGRTQALLLELAPGPTLMSRDNYDSMSIDNVASGPIAPELGVQPASLAALAPRWTAERNRRIGAVRTRAHR